MADEPIPPTNDSAPPVPDETGVLEEEEDVFFKTQMWLVNLFLGYWRHTLAAAAVALLLVGLYGVWQDKAQGAQQDVHAKIARLEAALPEDEAQLANVDWKGMGQRMETIASGATGVGATYAWIQAAQMYEVGDFHAEALPAWEKANAGGEEGVLGWSAASGYATALARAERASDAEVLFRSWADQDPGAIGEQALYALGSLFRDSARTAESAQAFEEFLQRYPESPLAPVVQQAVQELRGS